MALAKKPSTALSHPLDPSQALKASAALLQKISSDNAARTSASTKADLLAGADDDEDVDNVPIWLILTTKRHIIDKRRLKPGKIALPHPYLNTARSSLRICLITADPQRTYKDLIAHPNFPIEVSKRIGRVIGITKLKAKYKSFESRRQLLSEYDVFLADDRIITNLPQILGKVFYKGGSKRPVPVTLEGKRQTRDEQGNKRRKLAEGGAKVVKSEVKPAEVAKEIERTLGSALVHLAPSTTTAVKVGKSSMTPQQIEENVEAVAAGLVEKFVPKKWNNVRAVHMKGPNTIALPIWAAEELWLDEKDVLEEAHPSIYGKKKRKRGTLDGDAAVEEEKVEVIEVPGPDGRMRRIENTAVRKKVVPEPQKASKKRKSDVDGDEDPKALERAQKAARKAALQEQKAAVKSDANGVNDVKEMAEKKALPIDGTKVVRKARMKAADLI